MAEWFVAKTSEFKDGDRRIVTAGPREIGVIFKDGTYYAYSNICLHQGGPACEGLLIENVVDVINPDRTYEGQKFGDEMHFVCPWHGYEYQPDSGASPPPFTEKVTTYRVEVRGGRVWIDPRPFPPGTRLEPARIAPAEGVA